MSVELTIQFAGDMPTATVEVVGSDLQVITRIMLAAGRSTTVTAPSADCFLRVRIASGQVFTLHDPGTVVRLISRERLSSRSSDRSTHYADDVARGGTLSFMERRLAGDHALTNEVHTGSVRSIDLSTIGTARLMSGNDPVWGTSFNGDREGIWRLNGEPHRPAFVLEINHPGGESCRVQIPADTQHVLVSARNITEALGDAVRVRFATTESGADAVLGYLHRGDLYSAQAMSLWIAESEQMLLYKKNNPYAAAVGAYLLLRLKQFTNLHDWPKNLADRFEYLPDGCVIWATQLISQRPADTGEIRRYLFTAADRGLPIYTEGLRLLIEGLRLLGQEGASVLERVTRRAGVVMWDSPLTTTFRAATAAATGPEAIRVVYDIAVSPFRFPLAEVLWAGANMIDPERVEATFNQLLDAVRAGRSPEDAARRLATMVGDQALIEAAMRLYRERASSVRTLRVPVSVQQENFEPWYVGPLSEDRFWPSYTRYLRDQKGWDDDRLRPLDDASTKVLSLLPPPGTGVVSARGLVVGYVQSGKTSNFTAVISKAADVGYRLFIVLSGITDALRNQTQERLDQEIVNLNPEHWFTLTSYGDDFRQTTNANAVLTGQSHLRIIGVIKKNANRLRKLRDWLRAARTDVLRSCPILLIDDEADQASPNSAKDPERRTIINQLLVELLGLVPKVAYAGYTATPFANLLIDPSLPQDLYPRDFIVHLPQPAGYFGPERVFGRDPINWDSADTGADGLDMIRTVPESDVHRLRPATATGDAFEPSVTPALEAALKYFWMATAARHARGQNAEHSTMLVHTSQSIQVHQSFFAPIGNMRDSVLSQLRMNSASMMKGLRSQWDEEAAKVPSSSVGCDQVSFDQLAPHLVRVVENTAVKIENSQSSDRIDYHTPGQIYIVIGGNVLSRGLTLEGLTVSFFLRTASAYDTLLQMGRWFGFRPGYEDLPRVWMTDELKGFFYDLATVEKEIRHDMDRYRDGRFTPVDFGVRIRTHPQLAITSRLKMQRAVRAAVTYAGTSQQTTVFSYQDAAWLDGNLRAARTLVAAALKDGLVETRIPDRPHPFFHGVSSERIVEFLSQYLVHEVLENMRADLMRDYIRRENARGRLKRWNVGIVTREEDVHGTIDLGLSAPVSLISRARFDRPRGAGAADIKALMSALDDGLDLNLPSAELRRKRGELRALRDAMMPDTGLLLMYPIFRNSPPIKDDGKRMVLGAIRDVIGISLIFPRVEEAPEVEYMTADLSAVSREEPEFNDEEQVA